MKEADVFDLERFVKAQEPVIDSVIAELKAGRKRSHWMWFIFPQLRGLGSSAMADFYGLGSLEEARAYLAHPLLGSRLALSTAIVWGHADKTLQEIFGSPDNLKFCSSMTLFSLASEERKSVFRRAIATFCYGQMDERTLALLGE